MVRSGPERLADAVVLANRDLPAARNSVRSLRRQALRVGDRRQAESCLAVLRLFASVTGDEAQESRLANKLVTERGEWFDLYWLGRVHERRGRLSEARSLYEQALRKCPRGDPDRHQVTSAIAALSKSI